MGEENQIGKFFLNPYTVVKEFDLKEGMSVADFGSGSGHFSFSAANEIGKSGSLYAIDIRQEPLEVLKSHADLHGVHQLHPIRADLEAPSGSTLPDHSQDRVMCVNILYQVEDKKVIIEEAFRVVKETGKLVIIDWANDAPMGPPTRVSSEEVQKLAQEAGFILEKSFDAGLHHYGLLFQVKV